MDITKDEQGNILSIEFLPEEAPELFELEFDDVTDRSDERLKLIRRLLEH